MFRLTAFNLKEKLAMRLAIWSLKTLYGECQDYIWDAPDYEGEECIGCHATKVIRFTQNMRDWT